MKKLNEIIWLVADKIATSYKTFNGKLIGLIFVNKKGCD